MIHHTAIFLLCLLHMSHASDVVEVEATVRAACSSVPELENRLSTLKSTCEGHHDGPTMLPPTSSAHKPPSIEKLVKYGPNGRTAAVHGGRRRQSSTSAPTDAPITEAPVDEAAYEEMYGKNFSEAIAIEPAWQPECWSAGSAFTMSHCNCFGAESSRDGGYLSPRGSWAEEIAAWNKSPKKGTLYRSHFSSHAPG